MLYQDPDAVVAGPPALLDGAWEGECRLRRTTGEVVDVTANTFLVRDPETGDPMNVAVVHRDITERKRTESELRRASERRREMLAHVVAAQEDERRRIAGDIHDDSIQALAAVDLRLQLLRRRIGQLPSGDEHVQLVDRLREAVQEATRRLRRLLFELEPPALASAGLAAALQDFAAALFADAGVAVAVDNQLEARLPEELRTIAYRIGQEALTNVFKHAHASVVRITLAGGRKGLLLSVADDGVGIRAEGERRPGHLGLAGIRERAEVAGGWVELGPGEDGGGTLVRVWLPVPG